MYALSFSVSSFIFETGFFFAWLSGDNPTGPYKYIWWYANAALVGIIFGLIIGLIVAITQWKVVFQDISSPKKKIWKTAIGFSIWHALFFALEIFYDYDPVINLRVYLPDVQNLAIILGILLPSIIVGTMQWMMLRELKWWVWLNWFGWAMNTATILILDTHILFPWPTLYIGLFYGAMTGIVLLWLLKREDRKLISALADF